MTEPTPYFDPFKAEDGTSPNPDIPPSMWVAYAWGEDINHSVSMRYREWPAYSRTHFSVDGVPNVP